MTEIFNRGYHKSLRKWLRNNATLAERVFWNHIKGKQLAGFKFKRQCGIGNYVVDFYCPKIRLIVELDGGIHNDPQVKERDLMREEYLFSLGLHIKRYANEDVLYNIGEVLDDMEGICEELQRKYLGKCCG